MAANDVRAEWPPSAPLFSRSRLPLLLGWTVICWVVIFWRLSYLPLLDPDEAHYAEITREMLHAGQWLVPTLNGAPLIDKPVLFHWLQGASFSIFGASELAARLPSACAALALLWTTFWFGRRLFGTETGERGAMMLALMPLTFALSSIAVFDMIFTTFLFGAFATLMTAALERRWTMQVVGAALLSLAVQIKGPVAFVLLAIAIGVAYAVPRLREPLRAVRWWAVFASAGVLALPWFVWMWFHFGKQFVDDYVLYNNLSLFLKPLYRQRFYPFFYFRVFAAAFFPWCVLCAGRLIDLTWRRRWQAIAPGEALLWVWTAVVFVFFTVSRFKLDTYIYPLAPTACLLASCAWQSAAHDDPRSTVATRWSLLLAGVLLIAAGVVALIACLYVDLRLPPWALAVPGAAIAGGAFWAGRLIRRRLIPSQFGTPLVATLLVVYAGAVLVGFPAYRLARPAPELGKYVAGIAAPEDRVAVYRQERWKASVRFYSQHFITAAETPAELALLWNGPSRVYAVMVERDVHALRALGWQVKIMHSEPGVVGTAGSVIRQQVWGNVVVATNR